MSNESLALAPLVQALERIASSLERIEKHACAPKALPPPPPAPGAPKAPASAPEPSPSTPEGKGPCIDCGSKLFKRAGKHFCVTCGVYR